MNITPVILCGGTGSRLWPLSRQSYPKQFLKLFDDETLFQQAVKRIILLNNSSYKINEFIFLTNFEHRFLVIDQLEEINFNFPYKIILEPIAKNTAPALTLASLYLVEKNPESIMVVIPSDQFIKDNNKFKTTARLAIRNVEENHLIIFGIKPKTPSPGFGYIEFSGNSILKKVVGFKEKPNISAAKKFLEKGNYLWNAGIFLIKCNTWLHLIAKSNPIMLRKVASSWKKRSEIDMLISPEEKNFKLSPSDSIDYVVVEKFKSLKLNINVLILDAGWNDLGSYESFDEIKSKDVYGNINLGDVVSHDSYKNIAIAKKRNISLLGVSNLIVIETQDTVLVANKNNSQSIKTLVGILEKNHKNLLNDHFRVNRPWGWFEVLDEGKNFKAKKIQINPGKSISLQRHKKRSEHWVVVLGTATITKDKKTFNLYENESTYIKINQIHRISNNTKKNLQIIEVQSGKYLGEDDIERLEDFYGR